MLALERYMNDGARALQGITSGLEVRQIFNRNPNPKYSKIRWLVRLSSATTQCTKLRFDKILSGENLVGQDLKICGLEMCRPHRYPGFSWIQKPHCQRSFCTYFCYLASQILNLIIKQIFIRYHLRIF